MILDGFKIRQFRLKANLSQFDLGLEVDLTKEHICQLECEKRKNTSLETASKLSKYFKVSIEEIIKN